MDGTSTPLWQVALAALLSGGLGGGIAGLVSFLTQKESSRTALAAQAHASAAALEVQRQASDAALAAQREAISATEARDRLANERHDLGVRRQVKALLRDVQYVIWVARNSGVTDVRKWEPVQIRLTNRIAAADVALALSDDQADQTYRLSFATGIALQNRKDLDSEFERSDPKDATDLQRKTRATMNASWMLFEKVWTAFGDQTRLDEWQGWNAKVPPIA